MPCDLGAAGHDFYTLYMMRDYLLRTVPFEKTVFAIPTMEDDGNMSARTLGTITRIQDSLPRCCVTNVFQLATSAKVPRQPAPDHVLLHSPVAKITR